MSETSPFRVTWMPECIRGITRLSDDVSPPLRKRLTAFLREADGKLNESAREWGDPYADLKGMRATLYARHDVLEGLVVRYAVHMDRDEVFVRSVEPIPSGPFDVG